MMSDIPTRTHAQRVAEVEIITTSIQVDIRRAFELRDQEIDALRLRVEQEAAEVRRLTDASLDGARAIQAALLDALEAVDRRAEINRRLSTCSGPEFDAAMDAERVACDAWFASLTAWREAGYRRPRRC